MARTKLKAGGVASLKLLLAVYLQMSHTVAENDMYTVSMIGVSATDENGTLYEVVGAAATKFLLPSCIADSANATLKLELYNINTGVSILSSSPGQTNLDGVNIMLNTSLHGVYVCRLGSALSELRLNLSVIGDLEFMSFPPLVSTLRLNDAVPIPVTCCAHGFPAVILTVPSTGDFPGGNVTATPIASSEKETCYTTLFDPALSYHGDVLSFSCTAEYSADIPPCTSGLAGYSTCVSYRNRLTSQVAMFYIYGLDDNFTTAQTTVYQPLLADVSLLTQIPRCYSNVQSPSYLAICNVNTSYCHSSLSSLDRVDINAHTLHLSDSGIYVCIGVGANTSYSFELNVVGTLSWSKASPSSPSTSTADSPDVFQLECCASGLPAPHMAWLTSANSSMYSLNTTLTAFNTSRQTCVLFNFNVTAIALAGQSSLYLSCSASYTAGYCRSVGSNLQTPADVPCIENNANIANISCTDELDATVIPFSVFGYHAGAVLNYTCLVGYQRDTIRPSVCVWMSGSFQWFPLVTCSDIDECTSSPCSSTPNASVVCQDVPGSYLCVQGVSSPGSVASSLSTDHPTRHATFLTPAQAYPLNYSVPQSPKRVGDDSSSSGPIIGGVTGGGLVLVGCVAAAVAYVKKYKNGRSTTPWGSTIRMILLPVTGDYAIHDNHIVECDPEIRATGSHSFNTHTNTMAVEDHLQHPQLTTSPVNKSILDPENSTKKGASRWRRAASDVMKLHVQYDRQTPVHDWQMYDTAYASRHADLALLPIAPVLRFHDNEVQQAPDVFSSPDAVGAEKPESSPPQNASCSSLTLSDISDDGMYDTYIRGPTSTTYSHIRRAQPDGESQTDYMYITERARANDTTTLGVYVNNPPSPTAPEGPCTASNLGYLRPLSIQGNVWHAHRADLVDYDTYRNGYDMKLGVPDEAAQDTAADRPPMNTPVDDASISSDYNVYTGSEANPLYRQSLVSENLVQAIEGYSTIEHQYNIAGASLSPDMVCAEQPPDKQIATPADKAEGMQDVAEDDEYSLCNPYESSM